VLARESKMAAARTENDGFVVVGAHVLAHSARDSDRISESDTSAFRVTRNSHEPIGAPKGIGEQNSYALGVTTEDPTPN
jgi:hypothetical protein